MSDASSHEEVLRPRNESIVFERSALVGATVTLALIGGIAATLGTTLIGIAGHFRVPDAVAGSALSANFAGGALGAGACWRALKRWSGANVWGVALVVLAVGLVGAAIAPDWPIFVGAMSLTGMGFGALDFGMVALVARTARDGLAARMSVSGSGWALGSIAGPLVIVIIRPAHYVWFLLGAAVVGVALLATTRGVSSAPTTLSLRPTVTTEPSPSRRGVLATFAVAFGLYVALESAMSGWLATQLHGWGYSTVIGASITAGFWAGLAIGRIGLAPAMSRLAGHWFVLVGLAVTVGLLIGASHRSFAPYAYPVIGFALAAVFPVGLHWFTELRPNDHDGVALLVMADLIGGAMGTGAENVAVATLGLWAVPWVELTLAGLCLSTFATALRFPVPTTDPLTAARGRSR